jgi:hypothetical protein
MRLVCILLLVPILTFGCSAGDGASISLELQQIADCTAFNFEDVAGISEGLFLLLEAIDTGVPPAGVTFDLGAGTYSVPVDVDGDGASDGTVSGTFTSADNLADGIDVNESLTTAWTLAAGAINGTGNFGFERTGANAFNLTGTGSVNDGSGCSFGITDSDVTFDLGAPNGAVSGSIDFTTNTGAGDMNGTISFTPGVDLANVAASFLGATVYFMIDLDTFTAVF